MKKTNFPLLFRQLAISFIFLTTVGCATISSFDQYAYTQTTSLKVDALSTMDLAVEDYTNHTNEVKELDILIQKVYEYEKNRPKNEITMKMWDKLKDPNGHLLGGFMARWEKVKKLNATFITESKKIIGQAFDEIAGLESGKIKKSGNKND